MYIFTFGEYNSKQVNVSGIQTFRGQFLALHLRKVMLNAANIYLFGIIQTKCKNIYRSIEMYFYLKCVCCLRCFIDPLLPDLLQVINRAPKKIFFKYF